MPALTYPKDSKDLKGLAEFFANLRTQFASAAAIYDGPSRPMFDGVVQKLDAVLNGLPKTSDPGWNLTDKLDWMFDCMSGANSLLNCLVQELKQKTVTTASDPLAAAIAAGTHLTKESHDAAVQSAVTAATASMVPKDQVDQLCSAAKGVGIKEGRDAVHAEQAAATAADKLATERKAALQTAGLPLPEADVEGVLRAAEDVYSAARATAESRLKGFTEAGIELSGELASLVWAPEDKFGVFQKTVSSIPALRRGAHGAEPFAAAPAGAPAIPGKRMLA